MTNRKKNNSLYYGPNKVIIKREWIGAELDYVS